MPRFDKLRRLLYRSHQTVTRDPDDPFSPFIYIWRNPNGGSVLWLAWERGAYRFMEGYEGFADFSPPPEALIPCYQTGEISRIEISAWPNQSQPI